MALLPAAASAAIAEFGRRCRDRPADLVLDRSASGAGRWLAGLVVASGDDLDDRRVRVGDGGVG